MIKIQEMKSLIPPELLAQLAPGKIEVVVQNIAAAARNHWVGLAEKDSSHMRFDYISGIQEVEMEGPATATVALVGEVAHILEHGETNRDMRDILLGPDVPIVPVGERGKHQNKQGGYYRAIPIRHTTPGTRENPRGPTVGKEMGAAYSGHKAVADSKKLGAQVYAAAKKLSGTYTKPGGSKTKWGSRLKAGLAPKLKRHHKTDIYAGMVKSRKTYEKATQSQYHTFRTISTSVQTGWFRTIRARNFITQVEQFIQKIAPKAVRTLLEGR